MEQDYLGETRVGNYSCFPGGISTKGIGSTLKCESTLMGRAWASGIADGKQQGSSLQAGAQGKILETCS